MRATSNRLRELQRWSREKLLKLLNASQSTDTRTMMDTAVTGDFRTFHKAQRTPAVSMQRVVDPAEWSPGDLGDVATWSYRFTTRDHDELAEAVAAVRRNRVAIEDVRRDNFPLTALAELMA